MRSDEGKAVGLEAVEIVLLDVSLRSPLVSNQSCWSDIYMHTFVLRAADFAGQVGFAAGVGFEQVATVGAENERSNGGHVCGMSPITCDVWLVDKVWWRVVCL